VLISSNGSKPLLVSYPATAEKAYEERNNNSRPSILSDETTTASHLPLRAVEELHRHWPLFLGLGWVDGAGSDWHLGLRSVHTRIGRLFRLVARNRGAGVAIHAFWARRWSGFFLQLLSGLFYLVGGWMLLCVPASAPSP